MTVKEQLTELERRIETAQDQFESEWSGTSDDNGARMVGAAIIATGVRVQFGLAQLAAAIGFERVGVE